MLPFKVLAHIATESKGRKVATLTWVGVVAPAEDTLVGTGQGGCGLHAAMGLDAVEAVLVAAAPPPQHRLGPPAQLHSAMRTCTASQNSDYCAFLKLYSRCMQAETQENMLIGYIQRCKTS